MEIELYVVTHKEYNATVDERDYIGVGGKSLDGVFIYDNVGDNISDKNKNFCELTALYWIWKNSNFDYISFEHYRRFFCKKNCFGAKIIKKKNIESVLNKFDIILPKKIRLKHNIYNNYNDVHVIYDLDICRNIIANRYPDYLDNFDKIMKSHAMSAYNMFIMAKPLMDEYCEWLFDILFEAEKRIDISNRDAYQSRVFGFLSERLFNVWLDYKNLKCFYAPVYNIGDSPIVLKIKGLFRRIKRLLVRKNGRESRTR